MNLIFFTEEYEKTFINLKLSPRKESLFQTKRAYLDKILRQAENELQGYPPQAVFVHVLNSDYEDDDEESLAIFWDGDHLFATEPFSDNRTDIYKLLSDYIY